MLQDFQKAKREVGMRIKGGGGSSIKRIKGGGYERNKGGGGWYERYEGGRV